MLIRRLVISRSTASRATRSKTTPAARGCRSLKWNAGSLLIWATSRRATKALRENKCSKLRHPASPGLAPGERRLVSYDVGFSDHLLGRALRDNSRKFPPRPKPLRVKSSPMGSIARDECFESVFTTNPCATTKAHRYSPRGDPNWFRSRHAEFNFGAWRSTEEVITEADVGS